MSSFRDKFEFEKRKCESVRIKKKYPDRIPVIVERVENSNIENIAKHKYLVPKDLTIGQLVYIIRKNIKLEPEQAIFLFINNTLPPTSSLISSVYNEQMDLDGFLYISYSGENAFG